MPPINRWKRPICFGSLGMIYFILMAQVPVLFPLKLPLAALPLQIGALAYVAWYWYRQAHQKRLR